VGTVIEIINGEDENPNDGSFSQYVIVDFPNTVVHLDKRASNMGSYTTSSITI
jgi:hypothetical protein